MGPAGSTHTGSPFFPHGADPRGERDHLERQTGIPEVTRRRQSAKEKQQGGTQRKAKAAEGSETSEGSGGTEKQRKAAKAASEADENPKAAEKAKGSRKERKLGQ